MNPKYDPMYEKVNKGSQLNVSGIMRGIKTMALYQERMEIIIP
jgi:hypothetical protein